VASFAAPDPGGRSYKRIAYALGTDWLSGSEPQSVPCGQGDLGMGVMFAGDQEPWKPDNEWRGAPYRPQHALAARGLSRRVLAVFGAMQFFGSRRGSERPRPTSGSPTPPDAA
jgi:hypothetical protein